VSPQHTAFTPLYPPYSKAKGKFGKEGRKDHNHQHNSSKHRSLAAATIPAINQYGYRHHIVIVLAFPLLFFYMYY